MARRFLPMVLGASCATLGSLSAAGAGDMDIGVKAYFKLPLNGPKEVARKPKFGLRFGRERDLVGPDRIGEIRDAFVDVTFSMADNGGLQFDNVALFGKFPEEIGEDLDLQGFDPKAHKYSLAVGGGIAASLALICAETVC